MWSLGGSGGGGGMGDRPPTEVLLIPGNFPVNMSVMHKLHFLLLRTLTPFLKEHPGCI